MHIYIYADICLYMCIYTYIFIFIVYNLGKYKIISFLKDLSNSLAVICPYSLLLYWPPMVFLVGSLLFHHFECIICPPLVVLVSAEKPMVSFIINILAYDDFLFSCCFQKLSTDTLIIMRACINFFINDFIIVLLCCVDHEFLRQNNLFWVLVLSYSWPLSFGKLVWLFKQRDQIMKSWSFFFNNWNKFLICEIPYLPYSFMFPFNNLKILFIFYSLRILYMQIT